jgi:hypothetical protein
VELNSSISSSSDRFSDNFPENLKIINWKQIIQILKIEFFNRKGRKAFLRPSKSGLRKEIRQERKGIPFSESPCALCG